MNNRHVRTITLVLAVLTLGVGVSAAQPRRDDGAGVTVYDDVNFQGASVTIRDDAPDLRGFNFNDRISSLQMAPGDSWEVCENTNFGGRCAVLNGSERDLRGRGWNDTISSMRRVRGGDRSDRGGRNDRDDRNDRGDRDDRNDRGRPSITVYDEVNFQGTPVTFRSDVPDLREFGLNDRISSLQISGGGSWEVCENTGFGGRCTVISGSDRDLRGQNWNDSISSLRPVSGRGGPRGSGDGGFFRPSRSEIVLFDQTGYRGEAQKMTEAAAGLGGFTNRARSAQILDGVWELCEEARWRGRCVRVTSSVPDLGRVGLRGVASARPLER